MNQHGLVLWTLKVVNSKSWAGRCTHGFFDLNPRRSFGKIELSIEYMEAFDEYNVVDTVLHEIAHALAGPSEGHGKAWKAIARRIGCSGERTVGWDAPRPKSRYIGICPKGHEIPRHRLTQTFKGSSCPRCSNKFSRDHMFDIYDNGVLVHKRPTTTYVSAPAIPNNTQWVKPKPTPLPSAPMTAEEWAKQHSPTLLKLLQGID